MSIKRFNVTIIVADSDDPETKLEAKFEQCPASNVLKQQNAVGYVANALLEGIGEITE